MVDDKHFNRALLRFQLEPQLFLEGRNKRRPIGIRLRQRRQPRRRTPRRCWDLALVGSVLEIDIVLSLEVRFIEHDPSRQVRERIE